MAESINNVAVRTEQDIMPCRSCTVDVGSSGPASPYEWLLDAAAAPYNDLSPAIPIAGDEDNLSFFTTGDPTARWW